MLLGKYIHVERQAWFGVSESVDSLCRDDPDMPTPLYKRKACNLLNAACLSLLGI